MQTLSPRHVSPIRQRVEIPLKIVALGDSLIYGFGDPDGGGWVERLRRRWMNPDTPGHVLYNLGIRGDGVIQVSQRLEQEFRLRGELRNRVPDVIILSVGVNDSARLGRPDGRYYTDFQVFQSEMAQLLDKSQKLCKVIFVGMVPVNENQMPFLDCLYYNHAAQYAYKEATKQACEARGIPYLDIFDRWMAKGQDYLRSHLSSDGLHPNSQGYQALLDEILQWKPILELGK